MKEYEYDVALSFSGDDRAYVRDVAKNLQSSGISVFYDEYVEVDLWGKNLYTHLHDVYTKKAKYCVIFISKSYREKIWTNHERESAQERALSEKTEYILPARFDDTEIPGIKGTTAYVNLNKYDSINFAKLIQEKIKKKP